MGKTSDLSPRKSASVKLLLEENCYSQTEIAKRLGISQKSVSRIKMACDLNLNYEPRRVGKCGRKRKLNDRLATQRRLCQTFSVNQRSVHFHGQVIALTWILLKICGLLWRKEWKKTKLRLDKDLLNCWYKCGTMMRKLRTTVKIWSKACQIE